MIITKSEQSGPAVYDPDTDEEYYPEEQYEEEYMPTLDDYCNYLESLERNFVVDKKTIKYLLDWGIIDPIEDEDFDKWCKLNIK